MVKNAALNRIYFLIRIMLSSTYKADKKTIKIKHALCYFCWMLPMMRRDVMLCCTTLFYAICVLCICINVYTYFIKELKTDFLLLLLQA